MSKNAPLRLLTRRPLVGFSFVFILGCSFAAQGSISSPLVFVFLLLPFLLVGLFCKGSVGLVCFYMAVACTGALYSGFYRAVWLNASPSFNSLTRAEICGKVSGDPVWFEKKGRQQTGVTVFGELYGVEGPSVHARVRVVCPGHLSAIFNHGEQWRFVGRFYPYTYRSRYAGVLYVKSVQEDMVRVQEAHCFFRLCHSLRNKGSDLLGLGLDDFPQARGLLQAMLLGRRNAVKGALRDSFIHSGTLHLFALSGLHVGIISLLLIAMLKWVGVARPYWGVVLIPVLLVYVAMTGMRSSTLRAFVMAAIYWGGPLLHRRPDAPLALALAALVVLAIDPVQVVDPGFVLSFSVVGLLILACGYFREWLIPEDYEMSGKSLRRNLEFYGRSLILSSSVAWAASFPLALFYFQRASVVGPLANLLAVPLSFIIVLTGGITLVVGGGFPLAAELLNHANRLFLSGLCRVSSFFAAIPHGSVRVDQISVWHIVTWYVGLALVFAGKTRPRQMFGAILILWFVSGFLL